MFALVIRVCIADFAQSIIYANEHVSEIKTKTFQAHCESTLTHKLGVSFGVAQRQAGFLNV